MAHSHQLSENYILSERYRIVKVLGEGGFGITYEGYDGLFNVKVAIKEYYPIGLVNRTVTESTEVTAFTRENDEIFKRGKKSFLKEAKILAMFSSNPNIVSVKDFFEHNNTVYMVMELLEGTDVKGFLKYNGKMSFEDTFALLRPIMEALSQIHAAGLIHRDISPDNIMITKDGTTKLLDFGAAREMSADGEKSLSILLKPGFAPQEQYTKKGQQGPWTDVYALCATMYKIMTLQTPDDAMSRVFDDELENIRKYNPSVSEEECAVILKGMAVKIEDRYQSIGELIKGCKKAVRKKYITYSHDDTYKKNIQNLYANNVFINCSNLEFEISGGILIKYHGRSQDIIIPDNVVCIGAKAFSNMNIKSVRFPQNLKSIMEGAFEYCSSLDIIELPASLEKIDDKAFVGAHINKLYTLSRVPSRFYECEVNELYCDQNNIGLILRAFKYCKFHNVYLPDNSNLDFLFSIISCDIVNTFDFNIYIGNYRFSDVYHTKVIVYADDHYNVSTDKYINTTKKMLYYRVIIEIYRGNFKIREVNKEKITSDILENPSYINFSLNQLVFNLLDIGSQIKIYYR